jgi:hypothetical protein
MDINPNPKPNTEIDSSPPQKKRRHSHSTSKEKAVKVVKIRELNVDLISPKEASDYNSSKIVVIGKGGTGKCWGKGTRMVMYDGTIKVVEDIRVHDVLMGDDSTPRNVTSLGQGQDEMFMITTDSGEEFVVNKEHILCLLYLANFSIDVINNKWILRWIDRVTFKEEFKYFDTEEEAIQYREKLMVDVYSIYSWDDVYEIPLKRYLELSQATRNSMVMFRSAIDFQNENNIISSYLFGYWLGGGTHYGMKDISETENKERRISHKYKVSSQKSRSNLVSGIVDANPELYFEDELLVNDIVYVCNSLGYSAVKHRIENDRGFKIEIKNTSNLVAFDVKSIGTGTYYGFQLDGNGRLVLDNFIVNHNTTIIKSIIYEKSHIVPVGVVFSGTEDSNHFWKTVMPDTFVFNGLNLDQLTKVIKRQKIAKEYARTNPWAMILLDDCLDDPKLLNLPIFHGIYKNGRHWNILYFLSTQYAMDIRPAIRTNIDCTIILREPNLRNRKCIHENYASIIPDFKDFCQIMDQITTDYTALVIMNNGTSNKWQDCVFWYKAKNIPEGWKFGCDEYWQFHESRYNSDYRETFET